MVRSGVTSYRQLPVTLYQIRTKFRDEIRPRFGLMRGREFLMYDGVLLRRRCGRASTVLPRAGRRVPADLRAVRPRLHASSRRTPARSAAARRRSSWSLADTGEDAVVRCAACGYGANLEKADDRPASRALGRRDRDPGSQDVETPGSGGIDDVVEFLGITASRMIKCSSTRRSRAIVVALLRGDLDGERGRAQACARRRAPGARSRREGRAGDRGSRRVRRAARSCRRTGLRDRRRRVRARRRQRGHRRRPARLARRAGFVVRPRRAGSRSGRASRPRARAIPVRAAASRSTSRAASRSGTSSSSARSTPRR